MIDTNALNQQIIAMQQQQAQQQQQLLAELTRQRQEMQQQQQQQAAQQAAQQQAAQAQINASNAAHSKFTSGMMSQLQAMYNSNAAQMEQMGYSQLMAGGSAPPALARVTGSVSYQPPVVNMNQGWALEEVRQPNARVSR